VSEVWVCGYVLAFSDRYEGRELHRGDQEACERTSALTPAIAVNTAEKCEASLHVMPASEWDSVWA
jgi:hypothetical protein